MKTRAALLAFALFSLCSCNDKATSSTPDVPSPPQKVAWTLDIDMGPGMAGISRDTSLRAIQAYSEVIHGRIHGYSRDTFEDSVDVGSIVGTIRCPISDSGEFRFTAGRVLVMDGQTRLSIFPEAKPEYELSPQRISILVYNF